MPDTVDADARPRLERRVPRAYLAFANEDRRMAQRLRKHLVPLLRSGAVSELWSDESVDGGEQWADDIQRAIARSDVFVLLLTPNALASNVIMDTELPAIFAHERASGALVIPLILRPCMWEPFLSRYQALPLDKGRVRPVSDWRPSDAGYHAAAEQIRRAIERHFASPRAFEYPAGGARRLTDEQIEHAIQAVVGRRRAGA
jgi:hypothetical protein